MRVFPYCLFLRAKVQRKIDSTKCLAEFLVIFSACKYFKERILLFAEGINIDVGTAQYFNLSIFQSLYRRDTTGLCHLLLGRGRGDSHLLWYGHRESMWRDMWRELRRWSRRDRWRDKRGRDGGSERSRGWTPSSCLPMRYRQWVGMSRRGRLPTRCANHLRGIPGWRLSWWMKWCRRGMRTRCLAFHNLRGWKVLIYKELKVLNIYKGGGGKTDDADLAAGLRLVAKVSLGYIWLAFIIVIYVL